MFGYIFISSLYPRVINFLLSNKTRYHSVTPSFKAKAFTRIEKTTEVRN